MATAPANGTILSVSEITRRIRGALNDAFPSIWVRGELTGVKRAPSGHWYFNLKDPRAVLPCVLFAEEAARVRFDLRDGLEVEAYGGISVFEARGAYQLYVQAMRPAGLGERLLRLEELKRKLEAEGLFDRARKRPLPRYPRRIGLVTSPVGAAVRDMISVLRRRWPGIRLILAPVRVQGEGAAAEIASAIERFNRHGQVDLLIVGRGGGSLEDLWAFNEEVVARAIAGSRLPVVSAVGHEVDTTLADFAADCRAATPSNAAELAVRVADEVRALVAALEARATRATRHALGQRRQRLDHLLDKYRFRRPREVVEIWARRIAQLDEALRRAVRQRVGTLATRLGAARESWGLRAWPGTLARLRAGLAGLDARSAGAIGGRLQARRVRVDGYVDRLRALSPRLVLQRGYCLARRPDGTLLRAADGLAIGDPIRVEFARDEIDAQVVAVRGRERNAG